MPSHQQAGRVIRKVHRPHLPIQRLQSVLSGDRGPSQGLQRRLNLLQNFAAAVDRSSTNQLLRAVIHAVNRLRVEFVSSASQVFEGRGGSALVEVEVLEQVVPDDVLKIIYIEDA